MILKNFKTLKNDCQAFFKIIENKNKHFKIKS